jgi:hypothetical protein
VLPAAVLFNIAFPAVFQSWLDILSVLSLDIYTFIGEAASAIVETSRAYSIRFQFGIDWISTQCNPSKFQFD